VGFRCDFYSVGLRAQNQCFHSACILPELSLSFIVNYEFEFELWIDELSEFEGQQRQRILVDKSHNRVEYPDNAV